MTTITVENSLCPAPQHLPGVSGAATLQTPGLREVAVNLSTLVETTGVYLIDGQPGVGKTFGVQTVLTRLEARTVWVDMSDTPRGKEATSRVFTAVTGRRPPRNLTDYALQEETVDALAGLRAVIAIDEAQNMTRSALRALRYLSDRRTTKATLVLIGPGVMNTVRQVPEFDSRVSRRTTVRPLRGEQTLSMIQELHPVFAATEKDILVRLGEYAKGNLRNWARILEAAQSFGVTSSIDSKSAQHIVRAITGGSA